MARTKPTSLHYNQHFSSTDFDHEADSQDFHRLFGTDVDGNHQKSVYSDSRRIGGTGDMEPGDYLGDCCGRDARFTVVEPAKRAILAANRSELGGCPFTRPPVLAPLDPRYALWLRFGASS
jgi:hypothetical protein